MSVIDQRSRLSNDELIEIRVSDISSFLRRNRWLLFFGGLAGLCIGIAVAFSKSNEYSSQVTVLPEAQNRGGNLGNLSSLAGFAGINLDNLSGAGDVIRPDLYPNVLQSTLFSLYILQKPVYSKQFKRTQSLDNYLNQYEEKGIGSWITTLMPSDDASLKEDLADPTNSSGALQVTKHQDERVKEIQVRVSAEYDKKTGIIKVTAIMPDPVVAATIAEMTLDYLTNYAVTYRTEKARQQVEFLNRQVASAKQRYQEAEVALSNYRDRNRSLFLNAAKIEEQRLQAEFMLAQDLYNNLSKQLEMSKIKVQEETPVFKVLNPAQVPLKKSGPKRTMIMAGFMIAGIAFVILAKLGHMFFISRA